MDPQDIASREFPLSVRGYLREEVQAFLAGVASLIAERDNRIAVLEGDVTRLESQLADYRQRLASPTTPNLDRSALMQQLGREAANILVAADSSAERIRRESHSTAAQARRDLARIGTSLVEVQGFVGELVGMLADLSDAATAVGSPPAEISLAEVSPRPLGGGTSVEIRTVFGEVLGLDDGSLHGSVHLPSSGLG